MSPPTYLITGVTGNLGRSILKHLLSNVPASSITVTSSNSSRASEFSALGVKFLVVDFNSPSSMLSAFTNVFKLFFVSTDTFDVAERIAQHRNVVSAAEQAGVGQIFYSGLAIGGWGESKSPVEAAHLETERMMKASRVKWTSIRMGCYIDAFPLWLNWYPTDREQKLYLPFGDGKVAWVSIEELGEATANLLVRGGHENEIVLFANTTSSSLSNLVEVINKTTDRQLTLNVVPFQEYVDLNSANDEGRKDAVFFENWGQVYEDVSNGNCAITSIQLKEYLGREPVQGLAWVAETLKKNPNYVWHQNYVDGKKKVSK